MLTLQYPHKPVAMRFSPIFRLALSALVVSSCHPVGEVTKVEYSSISLASYPSDSSSHRIIAPYKEKLDREMNEIVGTTDTAFVKEKDRPETLLGNLVADIVLQASGSDGRQADISLLNNGGLRTSLPKGDISRGKIYELMPFDNEIVVLTLNGKQMFELFKYIAATGGVPAAGLHMGIKGMIPVDMKIGGMAFDSSKTYRVATSDYLAAGGDKMSFFRQPVKTETTGIRIRDAIISYFKSEQQKGRLISSRLDGRIHYAR